MVIVTLRRQLILWHAKLDKGACSRSAWISCASNHSPTTCMVQHGGGVSASLIWTKLSSNTSNHLRVVEIRELLSHQSVTICNMKKRLLHYLNKTYIILQHRHITGSQMVSAYFPSKMTQALHQQKEPRTQAHEKINSKMKKGSFLTDERSSVDLLIRIQAALSLCSFL